MLIYSKKLESIYKDEKKVSKKNYNRYFSLKTLEHSINESGLKELFSWYSPTYKDKILYAKVNKKDNEPFVKIYCKGKLTKKGKEYYKKIFISTNNGWVE